MLLEFSAILSIICGFLMAVLFLDPFTAEYCCRAVVSEDAKTTLARGLQTLSLEMESNTVSRRVRPWIKLASEYPFKGPVNMIYGELTVEMVYNFQNYVSLMCNHQKL